jgi:hypothetical protein
MKSVVISAAIAAAALALPAISQAQPVQWYGNIGYEATSIEGIDLQAIQGRLGARFNRFIGAEGEVGIGVGSDDFLGAEVKLNHQFAGYVVGFAPLSPNLDLLARVGYGHSEVHASGPGGSADIGGDSWNYGVGAQYHFDGRNGIRADWTRHDFSDGGDEADVWSVTYSRRF